MSKKTTTAQNQGAGTGSINSGLTAGLSGAPVSFAPTIINKPGTTVTIQERTVPDYVVNKSTKHYAFLSTNATMQSSPAPGSPTGYTINYNAAAGQVLSLPFNPNSLNFNYRLNKISFDTYGGRVTQLLSVKIDSLQVQGDAGSRANLNALFNGLKSLQQNQIESQNSILFTIPYNQTNDLSNTLFNGSNLSFYVWIRNIEIGWDPTSVTYPYNISFEVEDTGYPGYAASSSNPTNGYGSLTTFIANTALEKLFANSAGANEIGFGGGSTNLSAYYAGLTPVGGPNGYPSAGGGTATDTTQAAGLGSQSIYGGQ